jgi:hypothetical protein
MRHLPSLAAAHLRGGRRATAAAVEPRMALSTRGSADGFPTEAACGTVKRVPLLGWRAHGVGRKERKHKRFNAGLQRSMLGWMGWAV